MICERGDVVAVAFPFRTKADAKRRPALVISNKIFDGSWATLYCL